MVHVSTIFMVISNYIYCYKLILMSKFVLTSFRHMHKFCSHRGLQKYGFLDPYLIQFTKCSSNDIEIYIQNKLIQGEKNCCLGSFINL